MCLAPQGPLSLCKRQKVQFDTSHRSLNALARKLALKGAGLMVIHDQGVHDELARHSEGVEFPLDLANIHDARKTERSPGHRNRDTPDNIVDDLVPVQHWN